MKQNRDVCDRLEEAKSLAAFLRDCHSVPNSQEFMGELSAEGEQGIFWMLESIYSEIDQAEEDLIQENKNR